MHNYYNTAVNLKKFITIIVWRTSHAALLCCLASGLGQWKYQESAKNWNDPQNGTSIMKNDANQYYMHAA